ncbi:unnamed protein product [Meganyctiphanes norvegica]|uniref:Uncharacterized protein n=1 Tax=Meganyctiphanes norvegica TaxID=48144 RepID=A0AAV2PYL8_MEGNR
MASMRSCVTWLLVVGVATVAGLPPLSTTAISTNSSTVQLTVVKEEVSTIYVIVCPPPRPNTTRTLLPSVLTTTTTFTTPPATRRPTPGPEDAQPAFATALSPPPTIPTPIGLPSPPSVPSPVSPIDNLNVTLEAGSLDLSEQEEGGHEATVRARGCGWVGVGAGIPTWPNRLVFHTSGGLSLLPGWYEAMTNLTTLKLRAKGGLGGTWACSQLSPTLEILQMSHTPLELLLLQDCPTALKAVEMEHSGLTSVSLCAPNLKTLNVSWNQVSSALGQDWVECQGGANGVEELRVQHNLLSKVSTCGWPGLVILDVRNNQISELNMSTCVSGGLLTLMAAHNRLATPPELPKTLRHLYLNHNHLTALPALPHDMLEADFSHNQISDLGKARFKRARRLQHLNLAHNHISKIHDKDLHGLRDLRELDLSNNRLKDIAALVFQNLQQLKLLQLHHNHLSMLDSRLLASFPTTVRASFHNNPWSCTCSLLRDLKTHTACRRNHCRQQIQCLESDSWHDADELLKQCLHNVQEVNRNTSPSSHRTMSILLSDEDESDGNGRIDDTEDADDFKASQKKEGYGVAFVVPIMVVLVIVAILSVLTHRLYRRHRRYLQTSCFRCCPLPTPPASVTHDQLPHKDNDSDTETEL